MNDKYDNLVEIKRIGFTNEKEIHQTVENNLKTMLNLTLVDHEFSFGKHRIDTLAFDERKKIFVIIEYKIDEDKKISNQVYGYYGDMVTNKSDFLLVYRDKVGKALSKQEVNWENTRILLIAPRFDESLLNALKAPGVKFELWKIYRYQHGIIEFKQLKNINDRIEEAEPKIEVESIQEPKDLKDHFSKCDENTRQIYNEIERRAKDMDYNIRILPTKFYISFMINDHNFIRITTQKNKLLVYLPIKLKEMSIPKRSTLIIEKKTHRMGGDSKITIYKQADIAHLMKLVSQSYTKIMMRGRGKQKDTFSHTPSITKIIREYLADKKQVTTSELYDICLNTHSLSTQKPYDIKHGVQSCIYRLNQRGKIKRMERGTYQIIRKS